ncbi:MAG: ribosome maturation factor RimP [Gammaproteobacteria bacterium]|nr:ribosome maturation factor RimP [Gammaproteobacteria bacterium]
MYQQNPVLVRLLEPVVHALGYEMLGIEHSPGGRGSLLRIYIDSESGIKLEDCERVSEQVTGILDVNDPVRGSYRLEISSPGFDRPLFTLDHFRRFIGHQARLRLNEKIAGRRKISGEIMAVNQENVELKFEGTNYQIPADIIEKARLIPY